jgi:hypothetical protein
MPEYQCYQRGQYGSLCRVECYQPPKSIVALQRTRRSNATGKAMQQERQRDRKSNATGKATRQEKQRDRKGNETGENMSHWVKGIVIGGQDQMFQ